MAPSGPKRHLLHVMPTFAPGGVQIRVAYLMNHMPLVDQSFSDVRHTIIAMDGNFSAESRLVPGRRVELRKPPAAGGLLERIRAYRAEIRRLAPDLMLTYQWGAIEWALANRFASICPQVHLESGFGAEEADRQLPRRVWMRRLALGHVRAMVVPSTTLAAIAARDWWVHDDKIRYIPNGVDCEKYARPPVEGAVPGFFKQPGEKIVGTLTPLRPEKNLSRLIRAFAEVAADPAVGPARLLILGEGMERPRLEALARELGIADRVLLPGHVDAPEAALGWFDLYAISSDTEQMPNAVNQAMAAGKAVVGLDVGDVKVILSPENKPYVAAKGDDAAFAAAMKGLLLDDAGRAAIGAANAAHVRVNYTLAGMVEAYVPVWS